MLLYFSTEFPYTTHYSKKFSLYCNAVLSNALLPDTAHQNVILLTTYTTTQAISQLISALLQSTSISHALLFHSVCN